MNFAEHTMDKVAEKINPFLTGFDSVFNDNMRQLLKYYRREVATYYRMMHRSGVSHGPEADRLHPAKRAILRAYRLSIRTMLGMEG